MKNGFIYRYISWFILVVGIGCSPIHRFNRLVECHPYLLDSLKSDTIIVDSGKSLDTFFVSQTEFDTFYFDRGIRIDRIRDTFKIYYRERNCTTFIQKTEIKPSKIIEREIRKEIIKQNEKDIIRWVLYVLGGLLFIGLIRYLFRN